MRHQVKTNKLGRTNAHRKATLAALSSALIEHKRIKTTLAKAKALRSFVEPIITRSLEDTTHNRRQAFRRLRNKQAVTELFTEVAGQISDERKGGYTRIIKLGQREGDNAEMAVIELVDYNDVKPEGGSGSKRSRRTRRGGGSGRRRSKKQAAPQAESQAAPQAEEAPAEPAQPAPEAEQGDAPESQAAEAVASTNPNPDATGNPQVPQSGGHPDHPDAEQGAAPGTGEPNPDAQAENQGRSGEHRG